MDLKNTADAQLRLLCFFVEIRVFHLAKHISILYNVNLEY